MSDQVKALSNNEILSKLNIKYHLGIKFIPYHDLKEIQNIDEILPCILLMELHWPVGHWVCLYRSSKGIIQYFDPTGFKPDILNEIDFENPMGRGPLGADFTYLSKLLYDNLEETEEPKIIYNEKSLQGPTSKTCGYWCSIKLLCQHISNDDFNRIWMAYPLEKREELVVKLYQKL